MQMGLKVRKQCIPICSILIHLVYKQKDRNLISLQQPPQRHRVALHTIHTIDHKDRIIKYLQRSLHLRREIDMSRCIQKCHFHILCLKDRLLGKDRDPTFLFQFIIIQKGVSMIHTSDLPDHTAQIQKPF